MNVLVDQNNNKSIFQGKKTVNGAKNKTQYIVYIEFHKDKMRSKQKRRVNKLYKSMSKFIGTRNSLQCRSHHQKLEDRFVYPNKIITNYKQHNQLTLYNQVKLQLELYQINRKKINESHLKLQQENIQKSIYTTFKANQQNSVNTLQQVQYNKVQTNCFNACQMNQYQLIPFDVALIHSNLAQMFYYPFYQHY